MFKSPKCVFNRPRTRSLRISGVHAHRGPVEPVLFTAGIGAAVRQRRNLGPLRRRAPAQAETRGTWRAPERCGRMPPVTPKKNTWTSGPPPTGPHLQTRPSDVPSSTGGPSEQIFPTKHPQGSHWAQSPGRKRELSFCRPKAGGTANSRRSRGIRRSELEL